MISVVMASYNGEKYIEELLFSLKNQTMPPNEVIIFDDCSTDNTVMIIKEFISKNKLTSWKLKENSLNVGWQENFMNAFNVVNGDYIFPCDQDDIWKNDKIEKMISVMRSNENILLLAGNYTPIYEREYRGKKTNKIIKSMKFDMTIEQIKFERNVINILRPGCVFCFRKSLLKIASDLWFKGEAHDALFWIIANILDGVWIFNYSVIKFRRHDFNASLGRDENCNLKIKSMEYHLRELFNLSTLLEDAIKDKKNKEMTILKNIEWLKLRKKFLTSKRFFLWMKLVLKYHHYYFTKKSMMGDLYLAFKK